MSMSVIDRFLGTFGRHGVCDCTYIPDVIERFLGYGGSGLSVTIL